MQVIQGSKEDTLIGFGDSKLLFNEDHIKQRSQVVLRDFCALIGRIPIAD
ncbi:MAG TPA: hypothetical protein VHD63_19205 [Ktedonobacteraceae bacterium]|nr:hypothetical protein [Ktedonobacteraceae bacterium]